MLCLVLLDLKAKYTYVFQSCTCGLFFVFNFYLCGNEGKLNIFNLEQVPCTVGHY